MWTAIRQLFHRHHWVTIKRLRDVGFTLVDYESGHRSETRYAVVVCQQCVCPNGHIAKRAYATTGDRYSERDVDVNILPQEILDELGW